jgi:hypothetical protein
MQATRMISKQRRYSSYDSCQPLQGRFLSDGTLMVLRSLTDIRTQCARKSRHRSDPTAADAFFASFSRGPGSPSFSGEVQFLSHLALIHNFYNRHLHPVLKIGARSIAALSRKSP